MFQQYKRRLGTGALGAILLLLASAGCGHSSTPATTTTGSGSLDTGLGSSGGGTLTSPLGTGTSSTSATLAIPTSAPVTAQQQNCLTNNTALSTGFGAKGATAGDSSTVSTTGTTTAATTATALSCYSGASTYDPSTIYNAGLQSLQFMAQCYQQVANYQPPATATAADISAAFRAAQAQILTCYRGILAQQMQFANWNSGQQQTYNTQNQALYVLLSILQAQK